MDINNNKRTRLTLESIQLEKPGWGKRIEELVQNEGVMLHDVAQWLLHGQQQQHQQTMMASSTAKKYETEQQPSPSTSALHFARHVGLLKTTQRTGWVKRGVKDRIESVAEHSFRTACLCMLAPKDYGVNVGHAVMMALLHDLAECVTGDLLPNTVNKEIKYRQELEAMERILDGLDDEIKQRMMNLWQEYEKRETKEAILVKDLDRFDMVLQADTYEKTGMHDDLSDFFTSVRGKFSPNGVVGEWFAELENERSKGGVRE